jgi:hypothetical protein
VIALLLFVSTFSGAVLVQVAEEAGGKYALSDPRELHAPLRTDRWSRLCEALDGWNDLSIDRKCRLASLLHSMCLYHSKPILLMTTR